MPTKKYNRKWRGLVCLLFAVFTGQAQQYTVTGGSGTPLLAFTDTRNRLDVWLVYGMENAEIGFTSSSAVPRQWFRYDRTGAVNADSIVSVQNGTTSVIQGIEEGYGYFTGEVSDPATRYVWLIDYSKYTFALDRLQVSDGSDPCAGIRLTGSGAEIPDMTYYVPSGTVPNRLRRSFDISYNTLEWSEEDRMFSRTEVSRSVEDPFNVFLDAPLCDTEFQVQGDAFSRHFGREQSVRSGMYEAVAVSVHADTTVTVTEAPNMGGNGQGISAPAVVRFTAYANDPVAFVYVWTIYRSDVENGRENPIIRFPGKEVEYTFTLAGKYTAELEVANRTGVCSDASQSFTLDISETYLEAPNAFSPGSTPGVNDEFRVVYKSVTDFKGWIFNRWGAEMFRWTDPAVGWDGKKGGKYVPSGVYFYVIEYRDSQGKSRKKTGNINILLSKTIRNEEVVEP